MAQPIAGSIALVTGANRGIGRAIVDALVAAGAAKVYAAARSTASLDALTRQHGSVVVPVELDVTSDAQVAEAARVAADVTLLINNAGIALDWGADFTTLSLETARDQFEVNAIGSVRVTQAFAGHLRRSGGGTVVNISSSVAFANFPGVVSYSASKAALHSFTQGARFALGANGTTVIEVYPGPVDTDMAANLTFAKASPSSVAEAILRAIEAGDEEVYPDPVAEQLGEAYNANPKGAERAVNAMATGTAAV